ncbi:MAG: DNA translocase FtsK [Ruminococcaceae bacterium]|nr:DNA translocase FtsK [Oscillospiraceae bacterium]
MWRSDSEEGMVPWKILCYTVAFLVTAAMLHFFAGGPAVFSPVQHYRAGQSRVGGGVVGGVLGELMMRAFGHALSLVLLFALLFVFVLLMFGITPRGLWIMIAYKIKVSRERAQELHSADFAEEEAALRRRPHVPAEHASKKTVSQPQPAVQQPLTPFPAELSRKKKNFDVDVNVEEDYPEEEPAAALPPASVPVETTETESMPSENPDDGAIDEKIFEEVMRRTQERLAQNGAVPEEEQPIPAEEASAPEEDDTPPWEEVIPAQRDAGDVLDESSLEEKADEALDLADIFARKNDAELLRRLSENNAEADDAEDDGNDADLEIELSVERRQLKETLTPVQPSGFIPDPPKPAAPVQPAAAEIAPVPEYQFPPIDLLTVGEEEQDGNIAEELRDNAAKLVETLKNFNVKTKIVDVSRGPTITRYELAPEPGTKVRSIANLVDDIALNLATSGVRFEPSIPGKSAVGIEVPNKNAATVHLRTLLENPRFTTAKSRLTAALGQDVAGADVFLDVAKMPHLLIAGATGQGKSVCINSIIVSLLYKAKPDELKLIMVDPKKVELNIYNGIPHLYMPVISDPKKAAGALSWAVSEMERRYSLIEEVGVRDIKSYNEITKDDPQYEFLPQFVIIIDELADLMMVAKNDVEAPICRIAQKARAAGMHLIIGTQRPSVDVITGLIKANFPSRISFRVSQLVDSRTIIDRAGAESLVGRGDMLYSPVGSHEPMRVQGSFVSDEEVERVVEFIKMNNGNAEYNSGAIAEVERNAASIGNSGGRKGSSSEEDGEEHVEDDPMLRPAIELAVESGKISTSLIQRRLQLGYGRAAKLIDRMEQLGYVSAPDGQKPRDVLITKEEFMEMVLRGTDL